MPPLINITININEKQSYNIICLITKIEDQHQSLCIRRTILIFKNKLNWKQSIVLKFKIYILNFFIFILREPSSNDSTLVTLDRTNKIVHYRWNQWFQNSKCIFFLTNFYYFFWRMGWTMLDRSPLYMSRLKEFSYNTIQIRRTKIIPQVVVSHPSFKSNEIKISINSNRFQYSKPVSSKKYILNFSLIYMPFTNNRMKNYSIDSESSIKIHPSHRAMDKTN